MAHLVINSTPVRETDNPLGLHDPLTLDDLIRIEKALEDGTVEGSEADRLRAIHEEESAKLRAAIAPAIEQITAPFKDIGSKFKEQMFTGLLPERLAEFGKLSESIANFGGAARVLEDFKPLGKLALPGTDYSDLVGSLDSTLGTLGAEAHPSFLPMVEPLERAVLDQGATLDQIRAGIEEVAQLADAQRLVITELLHQLQDGGKDERRRHRMTICLGVIALLIPTVLSVISLLKG